MPDHAATHDAATHDALPTHPAHLWRNPDPKRSYDVVIVGGGGHGLATAYYLAKNHGITNVAVLERGWLAGGNIARNTAIIRSNYLLDESAAIYEHSLRLWETLADELDYDILFSQRGVMNLLHSVGDLREASRRVHANRLNRVDAELLSLDDIRRICPIVNLDPGVRYPVLGAAFQPRGGIAKHDHVAWAYARGADALGVDLIQGCEVTGFEIEDRPRQGAGGRMVAVETDRGRIAAGRVALIAAGHSSVLAALAGIRLPIQSHPLQALVSELLEPIHPIVVMSNGVHVYVSQAHKGELVLGAGMDTYNSYTQRGSFHIIEHQMSAAVELFPIFAGAHVIRTWGGIVDVAPDASPIIGRTPVEGLFLDCGWGTGGFKATPASGWVMAATLATGEPHPLARPYALERFTTGALIDEHGAAAVAH
ncbi:MAG: sarcosine oxidase subunit beta family protein [Candidatus Limnocylindrales bacterium]